MGNCLIEKLDVAVDNNALCTLDGMLFVVPKNSTNYARIGGTHVGQKKLFGDPAKVYFCSNTSYNDNIGQTTINENLYIKNTSTEDAYMLIANKYNVIALFQYDHQDNVQLAPQFNNGESFQYMSRLTYLFFKRGAFASKYLKKSTTITTMKVQQNKETLYLSDIGEMTQLTSLELIFDSIANNINSLAGLTNLTSLVITYCTGTSGTLESLLEGMLANGKTTNIDCMMYNNTPNITFGGSATQYTKHYICSFATNSITVVVDGNTIATYDGSSWTYN